MPPILRKDIVVLVADKNIEFTIKGLFSRHISLGIRPLTTDIYVHPERDPGCCMKSETFLRPFVNQFEHALVVFDRQGCGREQQTREDLERAVEERLASTGWAARAVAVIIDPELEAWVWSDSPHVAAILGWEGRQPDLQTWLRSSGFITDETFKPNDPKDALESALRLSSKARSSALYAQLAQRVSFDRCQDSSFLKLRTCLRNWFAIMT